MPRSVGWRVSGRVKSANDDVTSPTATLFHDLVVQVAIVRPGPIQGDMVHPICGGELV